MILILLSLFKPTPRNDRFWFAVGMEFISLDLLLVGLLLLNMPK